MLSVVRTPVVVRVPAKINLHLGVGPLREDGYHDLVTVFQAVSLFDTVSILSADRLRVTVTGDSADCVPADPSNLAARAAIALGELVGRSPDVHIDITKGIPVAGGMAGGSADAAATLIGLARLWQVDIARGDLESIAAELGSDVPFLLRGGTALGTGRGERLARVLSRGEFHWVIAVAREGLSTPAVYAELDRLRAERSIIVFDPESPDELMHSLASGIAPRVGSLLSNDLQAAAVSIRPTLRRTLRAGVDAGALAGVVSGSGPTCVFLCADSVHAVDVAAELAGAGVCSAVRTASGPVPGARVLD